MNNDLPNDEYILQYLDGELTEEDRNQFEMEMQKDPGLKSRVMDMQVTIEALRQAGTGEKIRGLHERMMKEIDTRDETKDHKIRKTIDHFRMVFKIGIAVDHS